MFRLLLLLGVAALLHWGLTHRRRRLEGLAADGLIDGRIVSVGTRHGVAFGGSTRWLKVVVRYVDAGGAAQTVTQDAAGGLPGTCRAGPNAPGLRADHGV